MLLPRRIITLTTLSACNLHDTLHTRSLHIKTDVTLYLSVRYNTLTRFC